MFQDSYTKLKTDQVEKFLARTASQLIGEAFAPQSTVILTRPLGFWGSAKLYDMADHRTLPSARRFVVEKENAVVVLDFTPQQITQLNENFGLNLTLDFAPDYLRFYLGFTRAPGGRFLLVESVDDIPWKDDPPPQARKAVGKILTPLHLVSDIAKGVFSGECVALYKTTLYKLHAAITPQGTVHLTLGEVLLEDLPVLDDVLGQ